MGLLAVIGPSRKEKRFSEALFLLKYFSTKPVFSQSASIFFSISGKLTFCITFLNILRILPDFTQEVKNYTHGLITMIMLNKVMLKNKSPRLAYIDISRGLAIIAVIASHTGYLPLSRFLFPFINAWMLPIFAISGGLVLKADSGIFLFMDKG